MQQNASFSNCQAPMYNPSHLLEATCKFIAAYYHSRRSLRIVTRVLFGTLFVISTGCGVARISERGYNIGLGGPVQWSGCSGSKNLYKLHCNFSPVFLLWLCTPARNRVVPILEEIASDLRLIKEIDPLNMRYSR